MKIDNTIEYNTENNGRITYLWASYELFNNWILIKSGFSSPIFFELARVIINKFISFDISDNDVAAKDKIFKDATLKIRERIVKIKNLVNEILWGISKFKEFSNNGILVIIYKSKYPVTNVRTRKRKNFAKNMLSFFVFILKNLNILSITIFKIL